MALRIFIWDLPDKDGFETGVAVAIAEHVDQAIELVLKSYSTRAECVKDSTMEALKECLETTGTRYQDTVPNAVFIFDK